MRIFLLFLLLNGMLPTIFAQSPAKRPLKPSDVYLLKNVEEAQVSPDGKWVAYTVSTVDTSKDNRNSDIWMVSWDGGQTVQLTSDSEGESTPRWSPDGKYISFISARHGEKDGQLWLMDRRGGEAQKATSIKGDIDEYAWSPDGKKIVLSIKDEDFSDTSKTKTRVPFVMNRYLFKQDINGYMEGRRTHLYIFNTDTKKTDTLTKGNFDEGTPAWSPDGKQVAFTSNRSAEADKNENADIWVMDAVAGATMKQMTTWPGTDRSPKWSPDGKWIAYTSSSSNLQFTMYGENIISIIPAAGGDARPFASSLDRPVSVFTGPRWAGIALFGRRRPQQYIAKLNISSNTVETVAGGEKSFINIERSPLSDVLVANMSEPQLPPELYAVENNQVRRLTHVQDSFVNAIEFAKVEGFTSTSKDGTKVSGVLYLPTTATAGQKLPLIMYIHGAPLGRMTTSLTFPAKYLPAAVMLWRV